MAQDVEFFKTLSVKEIRRRQSLCEAQIAIAYEKQNDTAMERLRIMENALMQAMLFKC